MKSYIKINDLAFLLQLFLILASCNQDASKEKEIKVDIDIISEKTFDDYISHIEIIQLETIKESLIKSIEKVVEYDNKYFIQNAYQNILIFDLEGHYIQTIGKSGRGPGDLSGVADIQINSYTGNIEILEPRGVIKIFNQQGQFLQSINAPTNEVSAFLILNKDSILFSHNYSDCALDIFSRKENKIINRYFELSEEFVTTNPIGQKSHFYKYKNEIFVHHGYTNEIFKLNGTKLEKVYQLDMGKNNFDAMTFEWSQGMPRNECLNFLKEKMVAFGFHNEFQTERFLFMTVFYRNDELVIVIDKKKNESLIFTHIRDLIKYDMTEIEKQINFWENEITYAKKNGSRLPLILNRDSGNEYAICSFDYKRHNIYINPSFLDSENLKRFNEISIEDNPVLAKYYFME